MNAPNRSNRGDDRMRKQSDRFIHKALAALDEGNWLKAVQFLRTAQDHDPGHLVPYHELADIYIHIGNLDAALAVIRDAAKIDPDDYQTNFILANIYLIQNKPDAALKLYTKIENVFQGSSPDLLFNMALAAHALNAPEEVLAYLKRVLAEDPSYTEAFELEAKVRFEKDDLDGAEKVLNTLLKMEPDHVLAHHLLGLVFAKCSRWEAAVREWEEALALTPDAEETMRELAWAYNMVGNDARAVSMLEKILEMNPANLQARIDLGAVFMSKSKTEEAIAQWEEARKADPNNPTVKKFLSEARLNKGRRGSRKKK